jgi:ferredoxin
LSKLSYLLVLLSLEFPVDEEDESRRAQGKHTVVVSPDHDTFLRFASVLTSAELEDDKAFTDDLYGSCSRCLDSCPIKALKPHSINIGRCIVYTAKYPDSRNVPADVRELERRLIRRPYSKFLGLSLKAEDELE